MLETISEKSYLVSTVSSIICTLYELGILAEEIKQSFDDFIMAKPQDLTKKLENFDILEKLFNKICTRTLMIQGIKDLHQYKKENPNYDKNLESCFIKLHFHDKKSDVLFQNEFLWDIQTLQTLILEEPQLLSTVSGYITSLHAQEIIDINVKNSFFDFTKTKEFKEKMKNFYANKKKSNL